MSSSRNIWRGVSLTGLSAWAWLMIVIGLLAILDFPSRFTAPGGFFRLVGVALIAMGHFVAAIAADRMFPGAIRLVTGSFEALAWVVVLVVMAAAAWGAML